MSIIHNCLENREYLDPCKVCPDCMKDPRNCNLTVYGICQICGEIVKD